MGTKNISLTPDLDAYISAKVASGEYLHASEVVRDALRLMMREEAEKLEWLRNAIAEGEASPILEKSSDEVIAGVKRRGRELLKSRRAQ
ncbi:MAG TPA: type II toxin-antitoxin system ParD family antitoxin [Candidatus Baltobacteraceae bacterium]|jgi:antitoxin ParD1/3/4